MRVIQFNTAVLTAHVEPALDNMYVISEGSGGGVRYQTNAVCYCRPTTYSVGRATHYREQWMHVAELAVAHNSRHKKEVWQMSAPRRSKLVR